MKTSSSVNADPAGNKLRKLTGKGTLWMANSTEGTMSSYLMLPCPSWQWASHIIPQNVWLLSGKGRLLRLLYVCMSVVLVLLQTVVYCGFSTVSCMFWVNFEVFIIKLQLMYLAGTNIVFWWWLYVFINYMSYRSIYAPCWYITEPSLFGCNCWEKGGYDICRIVCWPVFYDTRAWQHDAHHLRNNYTHVYVFIGPNWIGFFYAEDLKRIYLIVDITVQQAHIVK